MSDITNKDQLNNFLEITTPKALKQESSIIKKNVEDDYEYARDNIKEILEKGKMALDGILQVAQDGDSPRAYEVATNMLKALSEINKDLMDVHVKVKDSERTTIKQTNNAIFVGSTLDLQDMINKERSSKKAIIQDNNV
jgi:uncharacterized protein YktB (UPF0637 family)